MLKFFRRIRQQLLSENKFSKYLMYAIGEIILVVIGILIALQINNWNEARKNHKKLTTAVQSVYSDIVADGVLIQQRLPLVNQRNSKINGLIKRAYASETDLDTLVHIMQNEFPVRWYSSPTFNINTFSNLKATGTFDILPEEIKKAISNYYTTMETNQDYVEKVLDQYRSHLDDFVKRYNIIGRLYDANYKNSYMYNQTWRDIEGKDFSARTAVLFAAYRVLYQAAKTELETNQQQIDALLPLLKPYLEEKEHD
ncbi:DUF6090 family protein [Flagellimonas sp. DF-77]|uniref:DUF6090 family protein n=1 Tax=Flagellimonas algarum TaxID=3230298 RepID=UPI00339B81EE